MRGGGKRLCGSMQSTLLQERVPDTKLDADLVQLFISEADELAHSE